jgi:hypothetical protein
MVPMMTTWVLVVLSLNLWNVLRAIDRPTGYNWWMRGTNEFFLASIIAVVIYAVPVIYVFGWWLLPVWGIGPNLINGD